METLVRGVDDLRLGGGAVSVSDLLDAEPGADALPLLLDSTQGLGCGPSQNGLSVQRGLQSLTAGDPLEALHYLAECHSTTLRQYMIMKSSCRLAQLQVKAGRRVDGWPDGTQEALLDARRRLLQYKPSPHRRQEMLEIIRQVPPDWTVIQLTAVPRARCRLSRHDTPQLVLSRFTGGAPDSLLLTRVPAPTADHCCTFRSEFEAMLADNGSIQRSLSNDRQKYWAERGLLDDRMKAIVRSMEVAWLGRHAYLASGAIVCPEQRRAVEETLSALPTPLTVEQRARLGLLCARLPDSPAELSTAVSAALGPTTVDQRRAVTEALAARRSALGAAAAGARRGQVILVLDRDVQRYPWETVGALALGPACRLPSLALLGLCLAGRRGGPERPPAAGGATYILNPAGDLANTEQRMGPFLEERGWSGIVGRPPTLKEFAAALTDGLILAYCGHGSGSQYLPAEKLRSLTCNAVALLFGCSSGQLVQPGPTADPHGSVHAYLMANCPAILGNLWSVTDNMLDTYSKAVIEKWTDGVGSRSLPEAVSAARGSVSSTFMAAAPVVYGLPVTPDGLARSQTQQDAPVVYGLPVTHDGLARSQTQQDGPDRTQLKTQGRTQPDWILSDRTNRTPPDAQDSTQSRGAERAELEGPDSAAQSDRLSGPGRTQRDSALESCSDPGRAQLDKPSGPGRTKRDGSSSRVRTSKLTRQTDQQPDKLTSAPERARSAKAAGRTQRASRRI